MSKQVISTGTTANDGTGDTLRGAAIKINSNFTELYSSAQSAFGKANTAWDLANAAFTYANSSTALITQELSSNVEFIAAINSSQNTTISTVTALATNAYGQANTGTTTAGFAFNRANASYDFGNTVNNTTTSSYNTANSAWARANASFERANNSLNVQSGGTISGVLNLGLNAVTFDTGNIDVGNDALAIQVNQNKALTIRTSILDGFEETVHSWTFGANGNVVFPDNSLQTTAYPVSSFVTANNAGSFANGAFTKANNAGSFADGAFTKANDAYTLANSVFTFANTVTANISFIGADLLLTDSATETSINITPDIQGWAYLQLPNDATANTSNTRLHNDAGSIEFGTGDFSTGGSNTKTWYLNSDGSMSVPGHINLASGHQINDGSYRASTNGYVELVTNDYNNSVTVTNVGIAVVTNNNGTPNTWAFNADGSFTFPDATVQTTAFTGNTITGPDTANVTVNLNGTVSLTADDGDVNIATWTYDAEGNIILPAEAGLVTTGDVAIGYYDITAASPVGALASFYSTTANNAVVEITARNDNFHQNKVQIISDGATGDDYVNIELYDGGQTYGTMSWKFHKSGTLESAVGVAPTTSIGVAGDKRGMIIHTATHMYFCTADYDSTTDIWRRMEWNAADTW